ncbi:MAG: ABC transporter substrate binding protein [Candidatus Omnitrophota bacterium]
MRFNGSDLIVKGAEILLELAPHVKRIWIIHDKNYPAGTSSMEALDLFASSNRISLIETHVGSLQELDAILRARAGSGDIGIDAINIIPDVITLSPPGFELINRFSAEHKLPLVGGAAFAIQKGAVLTTIPDNIEIGRLAAPLADKIFRGIPAGTIPAVTPEAYLRINYKVIQRLGLKAPEGLLSRADEVIR